jgi:hypothetical protein
LQIAEAGFVGDGPDHFEPYRRFADINGYGLKRRRPMMRPMISAVAVAALIVVAAYGLRSKSPSIELSAAAMPSLQELHDLADVNKIPNQEIEDQSLVYPTVTKP